MMTLFAPNKVAYVIIVLRPKLRTLFNKLHTCSNVWPCNVMNIFHN